MTLALEQMRADIAALGLDSLRLMRRMLTWAEVEPGIDLSALAEYSTLGE